MAYGATSRATARNSMHGLTALVILLEVYLPSSRHLPVTCRPLLRLASAIKLHADLASTPR